MQAEALAACPEICANPSPNERHFGAFSLPRVFLHKAMLQVVQVLVPRPKNNQILRARSLKTMRASNTSIQL